MNFLNKPYRILTATTVFTLLILSSCKKENSQDLTPDEERAANRASVEADAEAEDVFNNIFDDVMGVNNDVGMAGTGIFGRESGSSTGRVDSVFPCATVTITHLSSTPFPIKIVIDFGAGCMGRDGHFRKGKIIAVYSDRLVKPGATAVTEFDNFYIDSIHVEGRHEIQNTSMAGPNNITLQFKIKVNGKLSKPSGNFSEWHSQKTITQMLGMVTPAHPIDDVFKIEGSANGKVRRGGLLVGWRSAITVPLIKKFTCRWISKGTVKTIRENSASNSPWYGELYYDAPNNAGDCDNKALLTINGTSFQITLH